MKEMTRVWIEPARHTWPALVTRPAVDTSTLERYVASILADVRTGGDEAIRKYALQFDGFVPDSLKVCEEEIADAVALMSDELKAAISLARNNISRFHQTNMGKSQTIEVMPGISCWRKKVAIQHVGLYIPGGTAPLFSTLLMLAVPAQIAGCGNIIVCTPAGKDGKIHPAILYTANLLGLKNIYKIGGVQAIAAMAYGSASVPKADKIFGPGNQYVTCAKQLVNQQGTAIDMPAGPSEVAIYADDSAVPAFVAADLLSQAEHGADSQVMLVASGEEIIKLVAAEVAAQLPALPRHAFAAGALENSRFIVLENVDAAFELLNEYAPEHLIIASDRASELSEKVLNAGSVFLGNYSPESAGDYASGTNHVLPTNGYARAYSGVSTDSFLKQITFQSLSRQGLQAIGSAVEIMAAAEGLDAHKNAVTIRLKKL